MTAFDWPMCVAPGCTRLINPDEHSFRCGEHRGDALAHRHLIATVDEAVAAVEELDAPTAWRVLARLAEQYPTAVWQAATADIARQNEAPSWTAANDPRVAHSMRFRRISNRYPRRVAEAYDGDLARAAGDSDALVADTVAAWELDHGLPVTNWPALGVDEGRRP